MSLGVVAIIGSPNVGKSTLFNRVVGSRSAIVDNTPGITRDRLYQKATWLTKDFYLIDTGGIELKDRPFQEEIRTQAEIAIKEADLIIFVTDAKLGLTGDDKLVARMLYKCKKPVILAVNKVDSIEKIDEASEFYALGLGDPLPISSEHGIGVGDLLDKVVKMLPNKKDKDYKDAIKFSIIGRPNVGKSTLVNALVGENRVIVSNISGTTRDATDTKFTHDKQNYVVIDTAGLKKRGKIFESIDKYSALRTLKAIDRADIALFLIDASVGITEQDKHVVGYAHDAHKAIIFLVNKWDIKKKEFEANSFIKEVKKEFKFLDYSNVLFISALRNSNIEKVFNEIKQTHESFNKRIKTSVLNDVILDAVQMNESPDFKGGRLKVYYAEQISVAPPTFVLFVNNPIYAHFSYLRYLENRLREAFSYQNVPLKMVLRRKM
ncbi:MAG: ribosome biogenesis GTPase Der [Bacilli bacterium]|nr:ribosome biogenesis GTPase Der [Bacilli bacterium]